MCSLWRFAISILWLTYLPVFKIHAQSPQWNKPVVGAVVSAAGSRPESVPGAYSVNGGVSFTRTLEPLVPLKDWVMPAQGIRSSTEYLDGLGRLLERVTADGSGMETVSPVIYDARGREESRYLPFARPESGGSFEPEPFARQQSFYRENYRDGSGKLCYEGEEFLYAKSVYEPSPLNRVRVELQPGNGWAGTGRGRVTEYLGSGMGLDRWLMNPGPVDDGTGNLAQLPVRSGSYKEGSLSVQRLTDEDSGQVLEYKDREGLLVARRVLEGGGRWLTTMYVYDEMRSLRAVLPPRAMEESELTGSLSVEAARELCFFYDYDDKGRVEAKKMPGAGFEYLVYDRGDRVVMQQGAVLRADGHWVMTGYDALGRAVVTGLVKTPLSHRQLMGYEAQVESGYSKLETATTAGAVALWMNPLPPGSGFSTLTVTAYDEYHPLAKQSKAFTDAYHDRLVAGSNRSPEDLPRSGSPDLRRTRGLVTHTWTRVLDREAGAAAPLLERVFYYDRKGRLIQQHSDNYARGEDISTNRYDFEGKLLASYQVNRNPQSELVETRLLTQLSYDAAGRLEEINKMINDDPSTARIVVHNRYDALGKLTSRDLGQDAAGGQPLERQQYAYSLQGWTRGVNPASAKDGENNALAENARPWFSFELQYDMGGMGGAGGTLPRYGGSVAAVRWRSRGDDVPRAYGYSYDRSSRLLGADYSEYRQQTGTYSESPGVNLDILMGDGREASSGYDRNGNIKGMTTWGQREGKPAVIDRLEYRYRQASNRLLSVEDAAELVKENSGTKSSDFHDVATQADDYRYDDAGNLQSDQNKLVEEIRYNYLNLPEGIDVRGKGMIRFIYDAGGEKLEKRVEEQGPKPAGEPSDVTRTIYLGDFTYRQVGSGPQQLEMIGMEEGRIRPGKETFVYDYFLRDHLGNVRMVLTDEKSSHRYPAATLEEAAVKEERRYYHIPEDGSRVRRAEVAGYPEDNTSNPNEYLQRLVGGGVSTGSSILLRVMSGDRVSMRATSWYREMAGSKTGNRGGSHHTESVVAGLISGLTGMAAGKELLQVGTGISETLARALQGYIEKPGTQEQAPSKPSAFLNYLLLDEQLSPVITRGGENSGSDAVGEAGAIKTHEVLDHPLTRNGYLYIWLSNTSEEIPVYFDDLQVTHTPGPLLEETHYYPFGMQIDAISSRAAGAAENRKRYNGIEFNDDLDLQTYDAFYRNLDPQIGRWWQIDPKVDQGYEAVSPYNAMNNNPARFSDLLGDEGAACCETRWKDIKDAGREIAKGFGEAAMGIANDINRYVNPLTPFVELVTGRDYNNGYFDIKKPRGESALEAGISMIPGGKIEGALAKTLAKASEKVEVQTIFKEVGILQQAKKGKGNFGLGSATAETSNRIGKAWVGEDYKVASNSTTLVSNDLLRQYRPPSNKRSSIAQTGIQANLEWRNLTKGEWQGNGHLDIINK